jgi:hypothetical protein
MHFPDGRRHRSLPSARVVVIWQEPRRPGRTRRRCAGFRQRGGNGDAGRSISLPVDRPASATCDARWPRCVTRIPRPAPDRLSRPGTRNQCEFGAEMHHQRYGLPPPKVLPGLRWRNGYLCIDIRVVQDWLAEFGLSSRADPRPRLPRMWPSAPDGGPHHLLPMSDRAPIILRLRSTLRHGYLGMGEAERARASADWHKVRRIQKTARPEVGPSVPATIPLGSGLIRVTDRRGGRRCSPGQTRGVARRTAKSRSPPSRGPRSLR